jgi:RNA polymerase sigma-70 factor (ECF subfamily)
MRHTFITTSRKKSATRAACLSDMDETSGPPAQEQALALRDNVRCIRQMPPETRRALLMIAAGEEYGRAAAATGTSVGTIKSRVSRARAFLRARTA